MNNRILITSALPYANGYIHLGHLAGAYLPADIYARYQRLNTKDLIYVCGSDEYGVAITIAAEKEGVSPKNIIDKYHEDNKSAFEKFGMSFDIYSRTSDEKHIETALDFFADFYKKGYLSEKSEEQYYDKEAKMFLPDRYVEGVCPNCGYDKARGDQCDSCGKYYGQCELINPKSLVTGNTPEKRQTTHWYMKFELFQEFLEKYIDANKDWKDNVIQQSKSWLKEGLKDRAITRDLDWGVKLNILSNDNSPFGKLIDEDKTFGKVLYVWFEAVLGYITATKSLFYNDSKQYNVPQDEWKNWWKNPDTKYIAFIGKDNIVFHTLIFPAMLFARNDSYVLPSNVPANEFLNLEGQKFSKSRNWSIDLRDFQNVFPQDFHTDALRYTLAMNLPETKDADFTWKDFQSRNNNELSAIFGNYVNRTLQFIYKNFDGKIPNLSEKYKDIENKWIELIDKIKNNTLSDSDFGYFNQNDISLLKSLVNGIIAIANNYEKYRFRDGVTETMNIARAANKYFNDEEPWKTIKSNPEECAKTLFICSQLVYSLAILFAPVIPNTSKKIFMIFNKQAWLGEPQRNVSNKINYWLTAQFIGLKSGTEFDAPQLLFPKIEDDIIDLQIAKLGNKLTTETVKKEELITIDDFKKIKLTTAKIIEAEKVKKSKKLLKLIVDLGNEKRQILAGVAEHYEPEYLINKTIVVVANLQPAKLMGYESNGMMLAANNSEGKLCFITPEISDIGMGAEVR